MYLTLHADTAGGIVQRNNAARWTLPRRDFRPRWRSMVTSLSPTGRRPHPGRVPRVLAVPAGRTAGRLGRRADGVRPGHRERGRGGHRARQLHRQRRRTRVFTGRQYVGLGRLDTERTDIGIFNAATDDIGILGDRPDDIDRGRRRAARWSHCRSAPAR